VAVAGEWWERAQARWLAWLGATVRSAGPSVAIAAVMEETLKLVPLAIIAFLAPGRARRFGAADWALLGLASGMGFQAAEDFVRRAAVRPGLFSLFLERDDWRYGWTLFGGRFDGGGVASYAGHHIETALVAAALGLAVRLGRRRGRRWLWAAPPAVWLVVVADHAALNAALADQAAFTSGRSTVPAFLHTIWSVTGHGCNRGWLLLGLIAAAAVADARSQGGGTDAAAPLHQLGRSLAGATGAYRAGSGPIPVRLANGLASLAADRRRREVSSPPFAPAPPWLPTRVVAGVSATLGVGLSVLLARSLAVDIGPTLRPTGRAWFAALLDALGDWWDGRGPGGQGLVVGGGLALLVLGALLLLPEVAAVAGGLVVTEGGLIVVGGTAARAARPGSRPSSPAPAP
jgi:hypothetical protein